MSALIFPFCFSLRISGNSWRKIFSDSDISLLEKECCLSSGHTKRSGIVFPVEFTLEIDILSQMFARQIVLALSEITTRK